MHCKQDVAVLVDVLLHLINTIEGADLDPSKHLLIVQVRSVRERPNKSHPAFYTCQTSHEYEILLLSRHSIA